ncbi:MAG: hypothetical protein O2819_04635 [Planctomycetota bacterium]|nr:hypothetical protein [Planctomycetota bacterium]MDA1105123.1 hypothetical protein [Planctomycetota bacterium]
MNPAPSAWAVDAPSATVSVSAVMLVIGLVLLLRGNRVLQPMAIVAGALVGWVVGSSAQAVLVPSWPWMACAIGGAVVGALCAVLGLRLLVAMTAAVVGAVIGLAVGAVAIDWGAVPAAAVVPSDAQSSASVEPLNERAASAVILATLDEVLGRGAAIANSIRVDDVWSQFGSPADGTTPATPIAGAKSSVEVWWATLDQPSRTVAAGSVVVGATVGFLAGLLFFKAMIAIITALAGGYLVTSAGWVLAAHFIASVGEPSALVWWLSFVGIAVVGCAFQWRSKPKPKPKPAAPKAEAAAGD